METADRVRHDRYGVGELRALKVDLQKLPDDSVKVDHWFHDSGYDNLFLYGQHGTGKTYLGLYAARLMIAQGVAPSLSYWTEGRFARDRDTLNWFRKTTSADSRADALWAEYGEYEAAFFQFVNSPLLMIDDMGYWGVGEWYINELWQFIKGRCENGLPTIIVSSHLPPTDSPMYSIVRAHFLTIETDAG